MILVILLPLVPLGTSPSYRRVSRFDEPSTLSLSISYMAYEKGPHYNPLSRLRSSTRGPVLSRPRSFSGHNALKRALSPKVQNVFYNHSLFKQDGSKGSFFFIRVQAIISILAASFTRILVLMPCSFSLPLSFSVKYTTKC